jgi:hypothetical protein
MGAASFEAIGALSSGLSEHAVEHLDDEALLGAGKLGDAFELLLELGRRPALATWCRRPIFGARYDL